MKKVLISLSALALLGTSTALAATAPATSPANLAANAAAAKEAANLAKKAAAAKAKAAKLARAAAVARAKADANPGNAKLAALAAKAEQQAAAAEAEASAYEAAAAAASSGDLAAAAAAVSAAPAAAAAAVSTGAASSAIAAASVELLDDEDEDEIEEVDSSAEDAGPSKAERRAAIAAKRAKNAAERAALVKKVQELIADSTKQQEFLTAVTQMKEYNKQKAKEELGLDDGFVAKEKLAKITKELAEAKAAARSGTAITGKVYIDASSEEVYASNEEQDKYVEAKAPTKLEKDKLWPNANKTPDIEVLDKAMSTAAIVMAKSLVELQEDKKAAKDKTGKAGDVDKATEAIHNMAKELAERARNAQLAKAHEQLGRLLFVNDALADLKALSAEKTQDAEGKDIKDSENKDVPGAVHQLNTLTTPNDGTAPLTTAAANPSDDTKKATLAKGADAAKAVKNKARKIAEGLESVLQIKRKVTVNGFEKEIGADETNGFKTAKTAADTAHTKALATYKDLEAASLTAQGDKSTELGKTWTQHDETITETNDASGYSKTLNYGSSTSETKTAASDFVTRVVNNGNGNYGGGDGTKKQMQYDENDQKGTLQTALETAQSSEKTNMDASLKGDKQGDNDTYKAGIGSEAKSLEDAFEEVEQKLNGAGFTQTLEEIAAEKSTDEKPVTAKSLRATEGLSSARESYLANEAANALVDATQDKDLFKKAEDAITEADKKAEALMKEQIGELDEAAKGFDREDEELDNE